jgi:hypothetical protein
MGKPVPRPTAESAGYWEGCRQGELRLQRCGACATVQFPPRRFCSACLGDGLEWIRAAGCGVVSSFTIVRHPPSPAFAADVPYAVALIALDEGPTMMAGLRGCDPEAVCVGMRVEVEFEARSDDIYLPYFHPAAGAALIP